MARSEELADYRHCICMQLSTASLIKLLDQCTSIVNIAATAFRLSYLQYILHRPVPLLAVATPVTSSPHSQAEATSLQLPDVGTLMQTHEHAAYCGHQESAAMPVTRWLQSSTCFYQAPEGNQAPQLLQLHQIVYQQSCELCSGSTICHQTFQ